MLPTAGIDAEISGWRGSDSGRPGGAGVLRLSAADIPFSAMRHPCFLRPASAKFKLATHRSECGHCLAHQIGKPKTFERQ